MGKAEGKRPLGRPNVGRTIILKLILRTDIMVFHGLHGIGISEVVL
jgi:hypothetical protein